MIEWAQSHISSRDKRFEFQHVDVQSGYEELDSSVGTVSPVEFVFPYADGAFTGALAASVFTHMDLPATSHYLTETARVLAPGGAILVSYFPGETTGKMGSSNWNFVIREDDLRRAIKQAELQVVLFDPGQPAGRQNFFLLGKPRT
jgi:hypothetical protein